VSEKKDSKVWMVLIVGGLLGVAVGLTFSVIFRGLERSGGFVEKSQGVAAFIGAMSTAGFWTLAWWNTDD
jgi:type III secretory pathway component EscT